MLLILLVAGALFAPNALALTVRTPGASQVALSANDSPAPQSDIWQDVDISGGWADPRINGGRLLDVSRLPVGP